MLDLLLQLVDKSLVQAIVGDPFDARYHLLETIRDYGLEKLREAGEEEIVRRRHLHWLLDLAERARLDGVAPDRVMWRGRLASDLDNVRAALAWCMTDTDRRSVAAGLRLAVALNAFWYERDHLGEGRRWLELLLAEEGQRRCADGEGDSEAPDFGAELAADDYADGASARHVWGASPRVEGLNVLALLAFHQQDLEQSVRHAETALALAENAADAVGAAHALCSLGNTARVRGEHERAIGLNEQGLALFRDAGESFGIWRALGSLAETSGAIGDHERSLRMLEEALAVARAREDPWQIAQTLRLLGRAAYWKGDLDRATALLEESLVRWQQIGATRGPHWSLAMLGQIALARGDTSRAVSRLLDSLTLSGEAGDRWGIARCLEGLASVAAAQARDGSRPSALRAARLLGAAEALREAIGARLYPEERPAFDQAVASARAQLGDATFAAARSEGRAMSPEQAVAYAREGFDPQEHAADMAPEEAIGPPSAGDSVPLTRRELEVAALIARGLTNRQIADALVLSERTVDAHVRNLLGKLGFTSRARIAAWAAERGLAGDVAPSA